ncbi:MAG: glycosyltransferase N-terminal domain-containing protein [Paracoccaceae bacterium]|nr:glycosyltransferase N-terminal domain-containing protein [Paracoccaceae bacterium]
MREPAHLRGIPERFGLGPAGERGAIWIYAASLGETRAAAPLIRRFRAAGYPVLLTHLSPAGMEEGWRLFPDDEGITHRYAPLDLFLVVRLFLRRSRPVMGVVLEVEIWPAMLIEARRAGVPMVMANGNLLEKSMGGMRGLRRHLMALYQEFTHVFTRTEAYRARYLTTGVAPERISVVGELKYDLWIDPAHPPMGRALRDRWRVERVLMIASSVRDEEPELLPMVDQLLRKDPGLGVLWVPRSPQRFDTVAEALTELGHKVTRRSALGPEMEAPLDDGCRVIVGDSIGEMNAYYPVADLVFVGASLCSDGGHNITEPMAHGRGVVMGPSIYAVAFAANAAAQMGAFESLAGTSELGARISALLADPVRLAAMGKAALDCHAQSSGAADRTWAGIEHLLKDA